MSLFAVTKMEASANLILLKGSFCLSIAFQSSTILQWAPQSSWLWVKVSFVHLSVGNIFAKPLSCTPSRIKQMLSTIHKYFWARSGFATFNAPERECEIWGTVQSWASNFYLHTHMQSIHVNITFVGTSVIYFIMFDARYIAVLSSTCFSTLSLWLFLDTYWSFFLYFYQAKYVLIFTEM